MTRPRSAATDAAGLARDAEDWRKRIARRARRANLDLSSEQTVAHAEFLTLLSAWNERMNLTSLTDRDEAVDRLILEPVAAAKDSAGGRGHPGRRVRRWVAGHSPEIQVPHASLCMVESKSAKARFSARR